MNPDVKLKGSTITLLNKAIREKGGFKADNAATGTGALTPMVETMGLSAMCAEITSNEAFGEWANGLGFEMLTPMVESPAESPSTAVEVAASASVESAETPAYWAATGAADGDDASARAAIASAVSAMVLESNARQETMEREFAEQSKLQLARY
jgi:hypothetical protein